jgi:predicted chitinase
MPGKAQAQQQVDLNPQAAQAADLQRTPVAANSGNGAAQDALAAQKSKTVDDLALDWVTVQVVQAAPEEMAEFAAANIPIILRQCAYEGITEPNQVAYLLATAEHESSFGRPKFGRSASLVEDHNPYSHREVPVRPRRKGEKPTTRTEWSATDHVNGRHVTAGTQDELDTRYWDAAYGGKLDNQRGTDDASRFRGRGFVQLTGRTNYRERSEALNREGNFYMKDGKMIGGAGGKRPIDLVQNPTDVNEVPDLAAQLLVTGARDGSFTTKKLDDFIPEGGEADFRDARKVINGDTALNGDKIARIARRYAVVLGRTWKKVFENNRAGGPR